MRLLLRREDSDRARPAVRRDHRAGFEYVQHFRRHAAELRAQAFENAAREIGRVRVHHEEPCSRYIGDVLQREIDHRLRGSIHRAHLRLGYDLALSQRNDRHDLHQRADRRFRLADSSRAHHVRQIGNARVQMLPLLVAFDRREDRFYVRARLRQSRCVQREHPETARDALRIHDGNLRTGELLRRRARGMYRPGQLGAYDDADDCIAGLHVRPEHVLEQLRGRLRSRRENRFRCELFVKLASREIDVIAITFFAEDDEERNDVDAQFGGARRLDVRGAVGDDGYGQALRFFRDVRLDEFRDLADDVVLHFHRGRVNGVFNGVAGGASVRDDAVAAKAQQRRAAVRFVVEAGFQFAQRRADQRAADLRKQTGPQNAFAYDALQIGDQALAHLEHYVSDESVDHDDVGGVVKQILAFHVADEVHRRFAQQLRGFEDLRVAFGLLFADRKNRDARVGNVQHGFGVSRPHDAELLQPFGAAIDVCARIEQNHRTFERGPNGGDRGTRDAGNRAQFYERYRQKRAAVAGRNRGVRRAVFDHADGRTERSAVRDTQRLRSVHLHRHVFGGVNDRDVLRCAALEQRAHARFIADERDVCPILLRRQQRSRDDFLRRVIAAHGIDRDARLRAHLINPRAQRLERRNDGCWKPGRAHTLRVCNRADDDADGVPPPKPFGRRRWCVGL